MSGRASGYLQHVGRMSGRASGYLQPRVMMAEWVGRLIAWLAGLRFGGVGWLVG